MLKDVVKKFVNQTLGRAERFTWDTSDKPLTYPPILIIGGPRTGSTLLYQCLVERFWFGYMTNLHHELFLGAAMLERLLRVSRWPRRGQFESTFGRVTGWTGPSESWDFWYRFFRRHPQFVPLSAADPAKMRELRGAVRALGNAMRQPLLFKNMNCAVRLEPIMKYLPEARFLVTQRDLEASARSILFTRNKIHHSYFQWWSIEPPNFDELQNLPPYKQVSEQLRGIYQEIKRHRRGISADWFYDVCYDKLCSDPESVMQDIRCFLEEHNIRVADRANLPTAFPSRGAPPIDAELAGQLKRYINATSDKSGHGSGILGRERFGTSREPA